ncbi:unnamed protein product, partial [Prorocentrum cordatum]
FSLRPRAAVPSACSDAATFPTAQAPSGHRGWASRTMETQVLEVKGRRGREGEGRSEEECEHRVLAEVAACQKVKTINLLQIASASVPALAKRHFQESVLLRGPWSSMKRWPKNF